MHTKKINLGSKNIALILLLACVIPVSTEAVEAKRAKHPKSTVRTCQSDGKMNMEKITSFTYHQSGGFAAINKIYEVKLADLGKEEREKLEKLIADSGLLSMKKENKTTAGAADMFFYEFTAVGGGEHHASFDDGTLPQAFRPLLDFVRGKATTEKH